MRSTNYYAKAAFAVVVSAAGALITALGPGNASLGDLSTKTWLVAIGSVLGSGAVVALVENVPEAPAVKAVIAFLSGGVASLVTALDDGVITQGEYLTAFSAAVVATGLVYQVSNASGRLR